MVRNYSLFISCIIVCSLLLSCGGGTEPDLPTPSQTKALGKGNGNYTLSTQTQIDNFSYTEITGYLKIVESSSGAITNLDGLTSLTSVGGRLVIIDNVALTSLSGLSGVSSLGGKLVISDNPALASLSGLNAITSVEGDLSIKNNDKLRSLEGLNGLDSVGGNLSIRNNAVLTSLEGLDGITFLSGNLVIRNNRALTNYCAVRHLITNGQVSESEYDVHNNAYDPSYDDIQNLECEEAPEKVMLSAPSDNAIDQNTTLTMSWQLVSEATAYQIQVATDTSFTSPLVDQSSNTTQYTTTLQSVMTYYWRVRASNSEGSGEWSEVWAFRTIESDVYEGDFTLSTQTQIDSFSYTEVTGNLTIVESSSGGAITNLKELEGLVSVGGSLYIEENAVLTSLEGLNDVTLVGGYLSIKNNAALTNLCAVRQLITNGQVIIDEYSVDENAYNPDYTEIQTSDCGNIVLRTQADIDHFSYTKVTGNLTIEESSSGAINNLNGLSGLSSVEGYLWIRDNAALTSLKELDALTSVGRYLRIHNNGALASLEGLDALTSVGEYLNIAKNVALASLTGLGDLTSVGKTLEIRDNAVLASLSGLSGLTSVGKHLKIYNNDALASLEGLSTVTSVGGDLRIEKNDELMSLSGLDTLTSVKGDLDIRNNDKLTSLSGLDNVTTLGGNLEIGRTSTSTDPSDGNPELTNLCGVRGLIINGQVSSSEYFVSNNAYNPTYAQMQSSDGDRCRQPQLPGKVTLTAPSDNATDQNTTLTLSWQPISEATAYKIQVSTSTMFSSNVVDQSSNTTQYTITLQPNTTYYWRVQAANSAGSGAWSDVRTFQTGLAKVTLTAPNAGVTGQALRPTLSWAAVTGATGYQVQVSKNSNLSSHVINQSVTASPYTATNLDPGTDYYWRVRASKGSINGAWSDVRTFQTGLAKVTLTAPNAGVTGQNTTLAFSWGNVTEATSYQIQVSTAANLSSPVINQSVTTSPYTATNLDPATDYYWRVRASKGSINGAWSDVRTFETTSSYEGDLTFSTQTQIDNFSLYTKITGNVIIQGSAITNLNGLSGLTSVEGYLYIRENSALTSLSGLNALKSVGGYLRIHNNTALTSLEGLSGLTSVGGYLNIGGNAVLTSLSGLSNVTSVGRTLDIYNNSALTSLSGLNALKSVGKHLRIYNNAALTSLEGLNVLKSVEVHLRIYNNAVLTSLSGLNALESVGGSLEISDNAVLTSLSGLSAVGSVGGNLEISDNAVLTSLSGLDTLTSVEGDLDIRNNDKLTSLSGLDKVSVLDGNLEIGRTSTSTDPSDGNPELTNLCGVRGLIINGQVSHSEYFVSNNAYNPTYDEIQNAGGGGCRQLQPPGKVALYTPSDNATDQNVTLTLSWQLVSEATAYQIQVSTSRTDFLSAVVDQSSNTTQYTITLQYGTTYYWRVQAINSAGSGAWSEVRTFQTGLAKVTLTAPNAGVTGQNTTLAFSWGSVTEATGYQVQVSKNSNLSSPVINQSVTASPYTVPNANSLDPATDYYWRVRASKGSINGAWSDVRTFQTGLAKVTLTAPNAGVTGQNTTLAFSWGSVTEATGYQIQVSTAANFSSTKVDQSVTASPYTATNLDPATDYYWRVRASKGSINGAWSDVRTFETTSSYKGDLTFSTQTQIDNFSSYTKITGNVIIQGSAITNLNRLSGLTSVGGYLYIRENFALTSLEGLSDLTSVGGYLRIHNNTALTSLSGLSGLTSVGGYLNIAKNAMLTSLSGLSSLTSVGRTLDIYNNAGLTSLSGLNALKSVGIHLKIYNNAALTSLSGLNALKSVGGYLRIYNNDALPSLSGLSAVGSVGGNLEISDNAVLMSLSGLNALESVGGSLEISDNAVLPSLSGLNALESVGGSLEISDNAVLLSLSGLSAVGSVGGDLDIRNNAVLLSLSGLSAVGSVGGDLDIRNNDKLTSLSGLDKVNVLGGNLEIGRTSTSTDPSDSNPELTNLCGVRGLIINGQVSSSEYFVSNNAYNPSYTQIQNEGGGGCRQLQPPGKVALYTPSNNATDQNVTLTLSWQPVSEATAYQIQVSTSRTDFSSPVINQSVTTSPYTVPNANSLDPNTTYYWRVQATNSAGSGAWSDVWSFETTSSYEGDLTLSTQTQIDNFSYTKVTGDLTIEESLSGTITNLNGLSDLTSVEGYLRINNNAALTSLEGLSDLTSVGGDLSINRNAVLTSLEGLSGVTSVGGFLRINFNDKLTSLEGLSGVTSVGGFLMIYDNAALMSLSGLSGLTSVGIHLRIYNNDALTSLEGLSGVTSVGRHLIITYNDALTDFCAVRQLIPGQVTMEEYFVSDNAYNPTYTQIQNPGPGGCEQGQTFNGNLTLSTQTQIDNFSYTKVTGTLRIVESSPGAITNLNGLSSLNSVGGTLDISNNADLTSLEGLGGVISVGEHLDIRNNAGLVSLEGLSGLSSVGKNLDIRNNAVLTSLSGLNGLNSVGRSLTIWNNDKLTSLSELSGITSVGGALTIKLNDKLTSLSGLNALTSVEGYLNINNNVVLTSLSGLSGLTSVGGNLTIWSNAALTSLSGLSGLTSVGGYLYIYNNAVLTSLSGLSGLISVEGYLRIRSNRALASLNGLRNLTSVGNYLHIGYHSELTSLQGLEKITSVGGDLSVEFNGKLTNLCAVRQLITNGQVSSSEYRVFGNVYNPSYTQIQNTGGGGCRQLQPPGKVRLSAPNNNVTKQNTTLRLSWRPVSEATAYQIQVSTSSTFSSKEVDQNSPTTQHITLLGFDTTYYWRVRALNSAGSGEWSEVWTFTTLNLESRLPPYPQSGH